MGFPPMQGLYDPRNEHDACGFGFVVDIKGRKSHDIVQQALTVLVNLEHRGAAGAEKNTGDGAGILLQMPHAFLREGCGEARLRACPAPASYGVGMVFLPPDGRGAAPPASASFEDVVREEGQTVLGWRDVPTDNATLGPVGQGQPAGHPPGLRRARRGLSPTTRPSSASSTSSAAWWRRRSRARPSRAARHFYVPSLSLQDHRLQGHAERRPARRASTRTSPTRRWPRPWPWSTRASRTNTFPSWSRAHPYRYISHNGEINTLRGNINWMHARQSMMASPLFGDDLQEDPHRHRHRGLRLGHVRQRAGAARPGGPLAAARHDDDGAGAVEPARVDERRRRRPSTSSTPASWSRGTARPPSPSPTACAIGAVLDRNGLRPARYYVTHDDLVVMASEVGVLDIPPEQVAARRAGCSPAACSSSTPREGRIVADDELKQRIASRAPLRRVAASSTWCSWTSCPGRPGCIEPDHETVLRRQEVFGYTAEDVKIAHHPHGRRRAPSPSARWAPTRRWRSSPRSRSSSSATSSSSSPR